MCNETVSNYYVGSYSVEITPPLSIPYLAGNPRHQFFKGVHDLLFACAAVISVGVNEVALITIDGIGICNSILGRERNFTNEIKEKIERETGIKKEAVIIISGHIHSTPDTINFRQLIQYPATLPWLETVTEQICSAIKIASQNKFKAKLKIGKGSVDGISMNRRGQEFLDTEAIILLFESLESDRNLIMVNYACHPVIVQVQELVSADYVGAMREIVKKSLSGSTDVLFIQGACGDINPRRGWTCNFRDVYITGAALAGEVIKIYGLMAAPDYPCEAVAINSLSEIIDLPSRELPSQNEIDMLNKEVEELQIEYINAASISERDTINLQLAPIEEQYYRIKEGNMPFKAEIQLIILGSAVLVGIPGEVMCKMGLKIKDMFKPMVSITAAYANGYLGYIASPEDWEIGGYEVDLGPWSKVGPESYNLILGKINELKRGGFFIEQ